MKKLILIIIFSLVIGGSISWAEKNVVFIPEKNLPRKIAILGPIPLKKKNIELSALGMIKNVIKNYMSGKGYIIAPLKGDYSASKRISSKELKKLFKGNPELDGILTIGIYQLSSFNIAFAQYYKMDGELCLYKKYKKLGCWRETATRKKLSIATDPLSAIATVVSSVVSSEGDVNIKNIIFDWAFKVSSLIPTFSSAAKKPKIIRVVTNVSKNTFKLGDKIVVGLEGTAGGKAYFDINPLIKNIPMPEIQNGIYKGMYVVKKGDSLDSGIIYVHLENERGERRDWIETSPLVYIDGIPPSQVKNFSFIPQKNSIKLTWNTTDTDVVKFELYRSEKPLSGYKKIAEPTNFYWVDKEVEPGKSYYYRIVCLDKVGNPSKASQIGPVSLPVLGSKPLPDVIVSDISSGKYFLNSTTTIPFGMSIVIGPNVDIEFRNNATLKINGSVKLKSSFIHSDTKNGTKTIQVSQTGNLEINKLLMQGLDWMKINGNLKADSLSIINGKTGLKINTLGSIQLNNCIFRGLDNAIIINDGKVSITKCNFERNKIALFIDRGELNIINNNFIGNKINIKSNIPLKIKANFFNTQTISDFKLYGKIEIDSFLSAPYPGGKEILVKDLIKQAKKEKQEAIQYLNKGNYGKAVEIFKRIVPIYSDATTYIYYIYSLSMAGDPSIEKVIDQALKKYPYETRIYQMGIRYFLQTNKIDKARKLLEKGLRLNPKNPTLMSMKVFFNENNNKQQGGKGHE